MARKVFYSFHYVPDNWRASQVRNIGIVEGNNAVSDNDWETVKRGGDGAIERWIVNQMSGRSCVVVLIGSNTAARKWINYEILKGWNEKKGLVGIHIHNLLDSSQQQSVKGANPFTGFTFGANKTALSSVVQVYDPPFWRSTDVYNHIRDNLESWVEEAIRIRAAY